MRRILHGCFNRAPFKESLTVQDGHKRLAVKSYSQAGEDGGDTMRHIRVPNIVAIPFDNSRECNYTLSELGQADPKCVGCNWRRSPT